jgi:hypothetical protein
MMARILDYGTTMSNLAGLPCLGFPSEVMDSRQ